jgi:GntR family transcriptional regulator
MKHTFKTEPLYDQLVDLWKEKIETELDPNSKLPSERKIASRYGVSRTTVRLAFQELEKIGYICRKHGKGTFVSDLSKNTTNLSGAYSFTEQMISMGKKPETKIFEFKTAEANKFFAKHLNLTIGEPLYKLKRLRLADGLPMMLERSYLPVKLFIDLMEEMLEKKPLYEVIEEDYDQKIHIANEEFYASIAGNKDAKVLNISEGAPVLHLVRTTYNTKNEIIGYTISVARADQFHYKIAHVRN